MSIYKGTELVAGNVNQSIVSTFKLFHHDWFDYSFSDLSWVCADDFEWIEGDKYPIAYEHLYADYISTSTYTSETIGNYTIQFKIAPDGHRIVDYANEGTIQNIYSESGVAWYYILDTVNERFKLPRTKHGLSGLRDEVGKYIAPGAPNITGTFNPDGYYSNENISGAFSNPGTRARRAVGTGTDSTSYQINFDASRSNSIYGNSTTIQPPSTQQYLYFYLGQFPVSALVNPDIAATKVNTNGDNFNSVGRNIANWSSNVTNCITEIPQDIKLELDNGTLILKAGSKVYIPNGFEQDETTPHFDEYIIPNDYITDSINANQTQFHLWNVTQGYYGRSSMDRITSSPTAPSNPSNYSFWYNTTDNIIKRYVDNAWTSDIYSLPICLATMDDTKYTSIDQIFNGFGYIGNTIFALPGVKALIPNGRNKDGSLNNINITLDSVKTRTASGSTYDFDFVLYLDGEINATNLSYSKYDKENNIFYAGSTGNQAISCGHGHTSSSKIDSLIVKTVFHALDWNDNSIIASWGMPSNKYIDLTLNSSDSEYTAPANGFYYICKGASSGQYAQITNITANYKKAMVSSNNNQCAVFMSVQKNDVVKIKYTASGTLEAFRFIYAEGEL